MDFKVGDEIWWFRDAFSQSCAAMIYPGDIELVHDTIKEIKAHNLIFWHCTLQANHVWGKTRKEAWARLKSDIEKWGSLD